MFIKVLEIGIFHNTNKQPIIKAINFFDLGIKIPINMGKINKPIKSESFPLSQLEYSYFHIRSFKNKQITPNK